MWALRLLLSRAAPFPNLRQKKVKTEASRKKRAMTSRPLQKQYSGFSKECTDLGTNKMVLKHGVASMDLPECSIVAVPEVSVIRLL